MKGKGRCDECFEGDSALRTPPLPCVKKSLVFDATWSRAMQCFHKHPSVFCFRALTKLCRSCEKIIPRSNNSECCNVQLTATKQ